MKRTNILLFHNSEAGKVLRTMRESRKLTQQQSAKHIGISQNAVATHELNYYDTKLSTLVHMANCYGYELLFSIKDKNTWRESEVTIKSSKAKAILKQYAPEATSENKAETIVPKTNEIKAA